MAKEQIGSPSSSSSSGLSAFKQGPWTAAEDEVLKDYIRKHGEGNWTAVQEHSGLSRNGKSCRLRWVNHLRPGLKKIPLTPHEENLIVNLHASMGNKWSRIAAHLPGRTDNEIKNFWNTRVKHRQRVGLPLHPPDLRWQASNYSQNNYTQNEFMFENLNGTRGNVPYAHPFTENSVGRLVAQGYGSQQYALLNQVTNHLTQLREPGQLLPSVHGSFANVLPGLDNLSDFSRNALGTLGTVYPYDPNPNYINPGLFDGSMSGSRVFLNDNFSASKSSAGALELELPSFQWPESDSSIWLAHTSPLQPIQTHAQTPSETMPVRSDCASSHNSDLLEELIHEANTLWNSNNQPSSRGSNCSTPFPSTIAEGSILESSETGLEEFNDPFSPMGRSAGSIFSESTTPSTGFPINDYPPSNAASGAGLIQATADNYPTPNVGTSETLPPDSPFETKQQERAETDKNNAILDDVLATLLSDDFFGELNNLPIGTSSMIDINAEQAASVLNSMPDFDLSDFL